MPANADSVVVELIAKNEQFNADVKSSAATYQQSMTAIEGAATGAEKGHGRLTASVGNSRIAMMEFQHVARGTADQLAAGAPLTQALASHMAMLGEAVGLAGGAFGKVGAVLSGPWGLALTAAIGLVSVLISKHQDEADTLEEVIKKKQKHREETALSEQADALWAKTIDGLTESQKKLNDEMGKRLQIQSVLDAGALDKARASLEKLGQAIEAAQTDPNVSPERLKKLQDAFHEAVRGILQDTMLVGQQQGAAMVDLNARAKEWADAQQDIINRLQGYHPELLGQSASLNAAFTAMNKAVQDAAHAGVGFDSFTKQVDVLNNRLAESPGYVKDYITQLKALAKQLEDVAAASKIDPVKVFKQNLIGAEGTGANRMGSSAFGVGQFMPSTWEHYFSQAYPDQFSSMSRAQVDSLRSDKAVAEGVIDAATKDYVSILQSAGQRITAAALYTMHLLSAGDPRGTVALRLLNAPADQPTSSFLSGGVLRGNPFLNTTAGDARAAIARRIGDSSGPISQGSLAIYRQSTEEERKRAEELTKIENRESSISLLKEQQVNFVQQFNAEQSKTTTLLGQAESATKDWDKEYERLIDGQKEFNQFGGQMVDEILNPDNWRHWGDTAKNVLHEVLNEIIALGVANPLKNLLFGQNNPTLGGIFSMFGGKGGGGGAGVGGLGDFSNSFGAIAGAPHFAGGGIMSVGGYGGTDNNLLSINGAPRAMVSGDEQLAVIPSSARAASGFGGAGVRVVVGVEANDYFDAKVMSVTGPAIAQSSMAAANGGAVLSRRNLSRESQHRLE
jgi:hypothetical protein